MSDPQIITAYAAGTATVLGAVTVLLAELRQWRQGRERHPPDSRHGPE